MHDNVGNVSMHEDLAGHQSDNLVRWHAAIRTTDPQELGVLLLRKLLEKSGGVFSDTLGLLTIILDEFREYSHDFLCQLGS